MIETLICITISIMALVMSIPSIIEYKKRKRANAQGWPPIAYIITISDFGSGCIVVSIITGVFTLVYSASWLFGG